MPTYAQNKPHIYKWRETHPEQFKVHNIKGNKKYRASHREEYNEYQKILQRGIYAYKRECKLFRNIDI